MSGGKGGSTSTSVKIPEWLETAAQSNLARADEIAKVGYTPYYGPDVAAFTPMQQAAMQNTNQGASAFGMAAPSDPMAGMPQAQTFAGGVQGYSAAPMYQQSVNQLAAQRPAQYGAITSMFIDPVTGAAPRTPFSTAQPDPATTQNPAHALVQRMTGGGGSGGGVPVRSGSSSGGKGGTTSINTPMSYVAGGVNTANPSSTINRVAAALSGPQRAPTAANHPVARPTAGTTATYGGGK